MRISSFGLLLVCALWLIGCSSTPSPTTAAPELDNGNPWYMKCNDDNNVCKLLKVGPDRADFISMYQNPDRGDNVITYYQFSEVALSNHLRLRFDDSGFIDVAALASQYVEHEPGFLIYEFSAEDWNDVVQRFRQADSIQMEFMEADSGEIVTRTKETASFNAAWNELRFHKLFMEPRNP